MSHAARTMRAARTTSRAAVPNPVRRERLLVALDAISDDERLILALMVYEDFTVEETAGLLGLTARQVRSTASRLMIELRRAVAGAPVRRRAIPAPAASELRAVVRRAM